MNRLKLLIVIFSLIISNICFANSLQAITDYHQTFIPLYDKKSQLKIAIRMYEINTTLYYLVVDPNTFTTETSPATDFTLRKIPSLQTVNKPGHFSWQAVQQTPYMQALMHYTAPPYKLQNYGVIHADHVVDGMFLTADMCPSTKPFESKFFNTLAEEANKVNHPIPIALSITGLWIINHPHDFAWLMQQEQENKLQITWINHSFSHQYYPDLPLANNFLLTPQTNMTHEILDTEKLLLENNQMPSVFFRAPGLVTDEKIILTLREFGLIPVGSDAWLAKNEQPKPGSIILVHGNSNEPQGIKAFLLLLQQSPPHLLPLSQTLIPN